jgi:hypothetical protein
MCARRLDVQDSCHCRLVCRDAEVLLGHDPRALVQDSGNCCRHCTWANTCTFAYQVDILQPCH